MKSILIPVDIAHKDESQAIIDIALKHAEADTRVVLVYVVEEVPGWASVAIPSEIIQKSKQDAETELRGVASASGREMETMVRIGHTYSSILGAAEDVNADLIVIASHRPGLQDYFLGSTAAKVVRHAPCSVLVVR